MAQSEYERGQLSRDGEIVSAVESENAAWDQYRDIEGTLATAKSVLRVVIETLRSQLKNHDVGAIHDALALYEQEFG